MVKIMKNSLKHKKGIFFSLIVLLVLMSLLLLVTLIEVSKNAKQDDYGSYFELTRLNGRVLDISSSYKDVLNITQISYTGNTTEQTLSLVGSAQMKSYSTILESLLDEYESGLVVRRGGINISHQSATSDFVMYPFNSFLRFANSELTIGGGDITDIRSMEVNLSLSSTVTADTDNMVNDGSGTILTVNIVDSTATLYSYTHTLSPSQVNEKVELDIGGDILSFTYGVGIFGDGTFNVTDNLTSTYSLTSLTITHDTALTSASGFYTNRSVSFSLFDLSFDGNIPLARG